MANKPAPTPQGALTIVKRLRNAADRSVVAALLRGYDRNLAGGLGAELRNAVPQLHYLSWFLIQGDSETDPPLLVMEANFDGPGDAFLLGMTSNPQVRARLDALYGFCMRYAAPGESAEVAARSLALDKEAPHIFYVARPGNSVQQIEEEAAIARQLEAIVDGLGEPRGRRLEYVRRIWDALGRAGRERILGAPEKDVWVRYNVRERLPQTALLIAGAVLAVAGLFALVTLLLHFFGVPLWDWLVPPPKALEAALWTARALGVLALLLLAGWALVMLLERPRDVSALMFARVLRAKGGEMLKFTLWALPAAALAVGAVALVVWIRECLLFAAVILLLGVLMLAGLCMLRLVLIAVLELSDPVDALRWNPRNRQAVLAREDRDGQNHFVSVTEIKPGPLRLNTLRAALCWINRLARIFFNRRGLAGVATIHFARWQILRGDRRLLFATNYDGGWAGYLGEFVALVAWGMNAIWGNVRGFPRTFYLFFDGVKDEQRFKAFARASQVETLFWYRRYPQLSCAAIRRNAELREDLARLSKYLQPDAKHAPEEELDAFLRRFSRG